MSLRYTIGDKVVIRANLIKYRDYGEYPCTENEFKYRGKIVTISTASDGIFGYYEVEDDVDTAFTDEMIDHEATATLNFKVDKDKFDDAISSMAYAVQDLGASMQENLKRVCNKIICSKGGETMNANEILGKWRNKKADELISQRNAEIKKVTKEDEIQKLVEEHETEINKIIKDKYKIDTQVSQIFCTITTRKTGDKIEAINKEFDKKVAELDEKEEEIKAVLKVAENQDKVFEILNKQGIIDKNYNIL